MKDRKQHEAEKSKTETKNIWQKLKEKGKHNNLFKDNKKSNVYKKFVCVCLGVGGGHQE